MTYNDKSANEPLRKIRLARPVRIDAREKELSAYIAHRFLHNNHAKYHRYCGEWISNLTADQIRYFIEEKRRIESGVVLR